MLSKPHLVVQTHTEDVASNDEFRVDDLDVKYSSTESKKLEYKLMIS